MRRARCARRFSAESLTSVSQKSNVTARMVGTALLEAGLPLLEEGLHRLARLLGGIGLRQGIHAILDGRPLVRVAPADDQLLLESHGARRALQNAIHDLGR